MIALATQQELKNSVPFLQLRWNKQNNQDDLDSTFIYSCDRLGQVIDLSFANGINVGYAIHRWFNFQCSKWVENMFIENGARRNPDKRDHDVDLTIDGVPFDIKLSIISNFYNGDKDLSKRANKNEYMHWLQEQASAESRKHDGNKIYVICKSQEGKCNFDAIEYRIAAFITYFKENIDKYKGNGVCELIYIE